MSKKSSLGRGLDALIKKSPEQSLGNQVLQVKIDKIVQAGYQPRQVFTPEALGELAQSIREKGVLQPLLLRPKGEQFEIVAGERRWRASQLAGLSEIPAIVREIPDREALEIAIIENLQREDLGPIEEARAYQALIDQGLNQEGVAKAVGKVRSTVANALRLLSLPSEALQALETGEISPGHARAILARPEADRAWALEQIKDKRLNVRESEALQRQTPSQVQPIKVNQPRVFKQLELALSRKTGTKVRINGAEKGKVELSYASTEELNRILEILGYQED